MVQITRYFIQKEPKLRDGSPQPKGRIEEFFHRHTFVVLGEPGLGKTTSFEYAVKQEPNAEFVRIGEFLSASSLDHLRERTLYLDGLDEHRSRSIGVDVMDAIVGRLKSLGTPKVRISCRTAEWHGGKDLSALSAVSNGTPVIQLELQSLSPKDIHLLVPDSDDFIEGAREHGLDDFLTNPQDFDLLHEFYHEKNKWPYNRSDLMDGACKALLKELNRAHSEAVDDWVTDRDLERASNYLASVLLLSNILGISSTHADSDKSFPCIQAFDGDLYAMRAATGRRVFKPVGENRIEPKHRKIAEYMAARYLASRVREGLPLRRVMALMTGIDGGTPPDLRGVYAWLVTLLSGMADQVLVHDPYGAIIYGDARAWGPTTKKSALIALQELAKKDPWFRSGDWSRPALGGLSDPALVEDFQQLLLKDKCESHLLSTILDVIAGGSKLPEMGDALLDFARNPEKPDHLKDEAIAAFATACPDRTADLVTLLDGVHAGDTPDKDQYLRGALLGQLYPNEIGPDRVVHYLVKPSGGLIGEYYMFVHHTIFEKTDKGGLRVLAQSFQDHDCGFEQGDEHDEYRFTSKLIHHLIEEFGEEATIDELSSWLAMGISRRETRRIRGVEAKTINAFLVAHDQIYIDLFLNFLNKRWSDDMSWHQIWWRFRALVVNAAPPNEFPRALLTQLNQETDIGKVRVLYELACILIVNEDPGLASVTFEELWEISKSNSQLDGILKRSSKCDIEEWRHEDATRKKQQLEERKTRQARNIKNLVSHKEDIESGSALGILEHYARVWFDLFNDVDHDATPRNRLYKEVGNELAKSLEKGFLNALLTSDNFNTLKDIAETDANSRVYNRGFLALAAMDIVAEKGKQAVFDLPEDILCLTIAYDMAVIVQKNIEWPMWLFTDKKNLVTRVFDEYWRVQIATGSERIARLHSFNGDEPQLPIAVKILPGLLRDFPKVHSRLLETMLLNAVRYCAHEKLLPLVRNALTKRFGNESGQRTMWVATGFVIDQNAYLDRLKAQLQKHDREKWTARPVLMADIWKSKEDGKLISSTKYRKATIELLGSVFKNVHFESRGGTRWISDQDEPTAADEIRKLIHYFAQDSSDEAAEALANLEKNSALSHWHSDILYTIANQIRTVREARFTYADVSQVVSTLSNAEPANVADLKALVMDILKEVATEIRHGNTDGYISFWNIEPKYGKATSEHINEERARDRLLELLRPKLSLLDILAEPEVRYAEGKRSDITIYCRDMKLPIEIKRDDHRKIWVAAEEQLKKQYSRDPASEGNGIYLVFWFDGKGMIVPPKSLKQPTTAKELQKTLQLTVPKTSSGLIDVITIDVSVPDDKKAKEKILKKVKTRSKAATKNDSTAKKKAVKQKTTKKSNKIDMAQAVRGDG